jgi:hypothetical protein
MGAQAGVPAMGTNQQLNIVNSDARYGPIRLIEPTTLGYLHVAAEVEPPRFPFMPPGRAKSQLLSRLSELAGQIQQLDPVARITLYDAVAIAPVRSAYLKEQGPSLHVPRFDVVVLIETSSPAAARDVQKTEPYRALLETLRAHAKDMHVIVARNAKRVGDVDKTRPGTFLFNYFVADDAAVMLGLWDYLAGWYAAETGLDNSTLLVPVDGERSDYLAINHARWDDSLPVVMFRQLARRSFWTYVLPNLEANRVGAMPILYRLANVTERSGHFVPTWALVLGALGLGAGFAVRRWRRTGRSPSEAR